MAKLTGFPWWPAFIKNIKKNNSFEVFYLSDFSRSFLKPSKIRKFESCLNEDVEEKDFYVAH